eukprot:CAMPEP_0182474916 /NCGR_PEP_ID=MMETSP1319-20130603/26497_1 /TAXON_ID=172717 /ORGANISM="Bolidomonas pacifica, Strain RCC208" /LENGTH=41 /DNA_ID= /DNA_START= /DNA_END= /DNA_ORIENTATION=
MRLQHQHRSDRAVSNGTYLRHMRDDEAKAGEGWGARRSTVR